jgi:hypothetical protein
VAEIQFEAQFPEPSRCWIVHAPRHWPQPESWWLDLAREELVDGVGRGDGAAADAGIPALPANLADVAYLPPVGPVHNWWRQEIRERLTRSGCDPVVQFLLGEEIEAGGGSPVVDLSPALVARKLAMLDAVPAGSHCCWPLIPGLTSDPVFCRQGLERLAAAGVSGVQPVVPELASTARRRLGELTSRAGYRELFHGAAPDVRDFARSARQLGLTAFLERPPCGRSGRALANRKIATRLHMLGELIQRTRGSMDESLTFYRAGRWADREVLDIHDLVRSRNLGLVPELTAESAREIELLVEGSPSERLAGLELDYLGPKGKAAAG